MIYGLFLSAPLFGHCAGDFIEIGDAPFGLVADQ
jgi:hypothetical protein